MQNRRKILGSLVFAAFWAVVAAWQPTSTFHLAPVIVAAWPAIGERRLERALPMSVIGLAIAVVMTVLLGIGSLLQGPSLLPWGGAGVESIVAAGIGAMAGTSPAMVGALTGEDR